MECFLEWDVVQRTIILISAVIWISNLEDSFLFPTSERQWWAQTFYFKFNFN